MKKKVAKYSALSLLAPLLWPFMLGFYLIKKAKSLQHTGLRIASISLISLSSLFIGTAWATGIVSPSPTEEVSQAEEIKKPSIETQTVTEKEIIPFATQNVDDPSLPKGQTKVKQEGKNGEKLISYEVTYENGTETSRRKLPEKETLAPVSMIISIGTYVAPPPPPPAPKPKPTSNCDPNYSGCVPIASDVDCAGGSGNGPAYVRGPISVIGTDVYDLDRDGNGIACE